MRRAHDTPGGGRIRVWDLPTRLFHWALALCMTLAFVSAQSGSYTAQRLHYLCGYAVLALVLFRLAWGLAGSRYARFAQFLRGPVVMLRYVRGLTGPAAAGSAPGYPGHNPLGALSVVALLAACGLQALTGLFSKDDIASEGPLAHRVTDAVVDRMTGVHDAGQALLLALLAAHLAAIAWHRWVKRENLVTPMITGDKILPPGIAAPAAQDRALWPRAALVLAASMFLVWWVIDRA